MPIALWIGVANDPFPGRFTRTFEVELVGGTVFDAVISSSDEVKLADFLDSSLLKVIDDHARRLEELSVEILEREAAAVS